MSVASLSKFLAVLQQSVGIALIAVAIIVFFFFMPQRYTIFLIHRKKIRKGVDR